MGRGIIAAAALAAVGAAALAAPAGAATTRVVDPAAGPYTTISDALRAAVAGDTVEVRPGRYAEPVEVVQDGITLHAAPGTAWIDTTSPVALKLAGRGDVVDGVSVSGSGTGARVTGDGAVLRHTSVLGADQGVAVVGAVHATIDHATVWGAGETGAALVVRNDDAGAQAVDVLASIVLGGRRGTAVDAVTGASGDPWPRGPSTVTLVHATVPAVPSAVSAQRVALGGPLTVRAYNSIVHGAAPTLVADGSDELGLDDTGTFRGPAQLDFHLRADAPAVGRAVPPPVGVPVPATDLDGRPLPALGGSAGALQYVNTPPSALFAASADTIGQGTPVTFDASASADPDAGGRIVAYTWTVGGQTVTTTTPVLKRTFAAAGTVLVGLRVTDNNGAQTDAQGMSVTVTDAIAPAVRITAPREGARLAGRRTVRRRGQPRRVAAVLRFAGRATDAGGVARVELTLQRMARTPAKGRRTAAMCTFYDPTRGRVGLLPCAVPPVIPAVRRGDAWSWRTPASLAVPAGRWLLTARATDRAGNTATTVLHFTVT